MDAFFWWLHISHPQWQHWRRRRFSGIKWNRLPPFTIWLQTPCGTTKRSRHTLQRGHTHLDQTPPPFYTASWVDDCLLNPHAHKRTPLKLFIMALIYYCEWIKASGSLLFCTIYTQRGDNTTLSWHVRSPDLLRSWNRPSWFQKRLARIELFYNKSYLFFFSMNFCALLATSVTANAQKCLHQQKYMILFSSFLHDLREF